LVRIKALIDALRQRLAGMIPLSYLVLDGHFGHHHGVDMARQCHLPLISKLRSDSALSVPYEGP